MGHVSLQRLNWYVYKCKSVKIRGLMTIFLRIYRVANQKDMERWGRVSKQRNPEPLSCQENHRRAGLKIENVLYRVTKQIMLKNFLPISAEIAV